MWGATPGPSIVAFTNTATSSSLSQDLGGGGSNYGGTNGPTVGSGSAVFYYELLVNTNGTATTTPTTLSGLAGWTATGLFMTNGVNANGRMVPTYFTNGAAVPYSGSGNENFLLAGWSANLGTTNWSTVYGNLNNWAVDAGAISGDAFFGLSTVATLAPSTFSVAGTVLWGSNAGQIYNTTSAPMELYDLTLAPEPGTLALAGLGGVALWLGRRRKG